MNIPHLLTSLGVSLLLTVGLGGCEKPGAGERAGRAVDQTVDEAGKKIAGTADKAEAEAAKARVAVDDAAVTTRIKAAFLAESGLNTLQISVDTVQGVVTLNGAVASKRSTSASVMFASKAVSQRCGRSRMVGAAGIFSLELC